MTRYGVLIDGRHGGYGVVFPDLPGCTAMGRTLDEALRHAMEAAGEWAQAVALPRPRLLKALRDDKCVKAVAVLAIVPLVFDSGKPAKAIASPIELTY